MRRLFPIVLSVACLTAGLSPAAAQQPGVEAQQPAATPQPPVAAATPADDPLAEVALEELLKIKVYAASKFAQDMAQAPASVSIVTADEIRSHGYRTLADILRTVRGFYITYDRNYSYVGVRGFSRPGDYNSRVLVLVNGHRLNDTIFEQALVGTESPIDVNLIDRVEVVRGPSSSLYGTSAFFAVVNIVTRSGRSLSGAEVQAAAGSQELRSGRVTVGGRRRNGIEGLLSVSAYASSGNTRLYYPEFDNEDDNNGIARRIDDDRSASVFGSVVAGAFTLQGGFGSRTKQVPTGAFGTLFNDPETETRDARGFAELQYSRRLESRSTLQLRAAFDSYQYDGAYAYETGLFKDNGRGAWVTTELSLIRQFDRHGLTAGFEYRDNLKQDQAAEDETGILLDDHRQTEVAGLYLEDEFHLTPRVLLNAGLRWDHYFDTFGGTLNPRLGLIVSPSESSALKLLYGRAFRAPNPFELYYDQNALSEALKPERIVTYEAVWEQRLHETLRATATTFHYRARDLIAQATGGDTIDGLYYANADNARATGAEVELQADLPGRLRGRVAHTFQSVTTDAASQSISNSPRHLSMVVVDAPLSRTGLRLGFNGYRIGRRRTVFGETVDGAFVGDLTLSRAERRGALGFSLTIRNLFDNAFSDPGSVEHRQRAIPQDGRTVSARATWRF